MPPPRTTPDSGMGCGWKISTDTLARPIGGSEISYLPVSLWERWHIDKPCADRYRERDAARRANVFISDDEGASWRYRGGIIFKHSCFNEHSVVELADGRLWMLSRGMKEAFQSFSSDGGGTWKPQATFFPHVNSKAVFRRLQSGNLLLVKHGQDFRALPERKGPKDGGVRKELTAFLSSDDGKTWSKGLLLDERSSVTLLRTRRHFFGK